MAVERAGSIVGRPHVTTNKVAAWTGARGFASLLRLLGRPYVLGVGKRKVVEAGDVQQRHIEIDRGLVVWRVERAALGGMLIDAEGHVERALNVCCRAFDIQDHAILGGVDDEGPAAN